MSQWLTTQTAILILGGDGNKPGWKETEVIDLSNLELTCDSYGTLPWPRFYAVGGFIDNTPIVCGDTNYSPDDCLIFGQSQTLLPMAGQRYYAASVMLNSIMMWITGGIDQGNYLDTSEYVTLEKTTPGPELPYNLNSICVD